VSQRLPQQPGEWIDRSRPLRFQFEGRDYTGFVGDTITSALWASGVRMLGRSFKYHRPRGVLSLANHDVNNIVQGGGATNIRADVTPVTDGGDYSAVNTFGGLARDSARRVEWFSKLLPVGFYYKAFHTPRMLFPFYERKMREMAGLGAVDPKGPLFKTPKAYDFCDVVIIGAGPAGLAAAIAAGEQGASVLVVDENRTPGGTLGYQYATDASAPSRLSALLSKIQSLPNVRLRMSTEAAGYYADHWIALVDAQRLTKLRARSVVIASGAMEQPAVFHNNDLPGVMLASAAQRLIRRFAVKPFDRAVVLAGNSDAYQATLDLLDAGVEVTAIVDLREKSDSPSAAQQEKLAAANVRIYQHHTVYVARAGKGKTSIVGATICPLDPQGQPAVDRSIDVPCDGIAMSVGWMPCDALINQAGGKMAYSERVEQFVPKTMPTGIFAAGRVNGIYVLEDQIRDGHRAGLMAAAHIGRFHSEVPPAIEHRGEPPSHPFPIFPHPKGKEFVDFDEDVQFNDIKNAVQEGFDSIELIKRYTTLGMGPSQGKVASMNGVRILAKIRGQSIAQTGTTTSRPFYHPVSFAHLAGKNFHPHRHTAMHSRHQQAGAVFMPAGVWQRPAYYAPHGRSREESIQAEVLSVRQRAGMIDVGTLGKFEVNGPDAAEFLERTYTGRFANMKPGTTRYLLMCDESGVDDGVVARLSADRFYVTATTTGADAVYREMQRNVLVWGLNVVPINLTGAYAAMNVAGPHARRILSTLTEIQLDQEAFPYLGMRQGVVAGAPARLLRVGFVGELGYEIHVPSQFGAHVWDQIMQAGAQHGILPFGVEAQRILRLEKGHIIIGQDTDGLTNPFEAGMEWAVKMDKPFFIGQRSLKIIRAKKSAAQRVLVGFMLPQDYSGPVPKECHLVIKNSTITGRVTSVAFSATLNRVLGMAYVGRDESKIGNRITIRVDGAREIEAAVVKTPFYDPDSHRQNEPFT
jgi:sarcosine oxidase subunit alpha